jgi:hypothetical protein
MKSLMVALLLLISAGASASDIIYEGPADWSSFDKFMNSKAREDEISGISYMISGVIASVGGAVGYYSSEDPNSRGLYAVAESVGVAALGYGATVYFVGNEYVSFYRAVDGSRLSPLQKTEILKRFLDNEKKENERRRWIKVATHSLIAAINFYSASRDEDRNIRGVLNFLGAVNLVMAATYAF